MGGLPPQALSGATYLGVEFGVFTRESINDTTLTVSPVYQSRFLSILTEINSELISRGRNIDDLHFSQKKMEAQGLEAEEWVIRFECERIKNHPLISQVLRISSDAIDAGYDILSFDSLESLLFDRFIEVKSYKGSPHFFWSANEIKVAEEKGEKYYLYLVDMNKLAEFGYSPLMIRGPHSYFFGQEQNEWVREPTQFKFSVKA